MNFKFFKGAAVAVVSGLMSLAGLLAAENAPARAMPKLSLDDSPVARAGVVTSYADVLEPMQQAVVTIKAIKHSSSLQLPPMVRGNNPLRDPDETSLGSGVIVSPDGYILTNNHVVQEADELKVTLPDERVVTATLIGTDSKTDIAVIKIEGDNFSAITLADSDKLRVGDLVFAVGNPLAVGQSITMGIVSAKGRKGIIDESERGYEDFIQTDAAINLGNSGGALVDAKGRLVGINSAILSTTRGPIGGNIGIGFAVPVNLAARIMTNLIATGTVSRGFLGVHVDEFDADVAELLGLKKDTRGVVVNEVVGDSPAAKAGLKKGDVIISIDGKTIASRDGLGLVVSQKDPGSTAKVEYVRSGKEQLAEIVLGTLTDSVEPAGFLKNVTVEMLTPDLLRQLRIDSSLTGLIVREVSPKSANKEKLEVDMIILEINGERFTDLTSAKRLLKPINNVFLVQNDRYAAARLIGIKNE